MKSQKIMQGSSIVLAVFFVFLVQITPFSSYQTYLLAILIIFSIIYISMKRRHEMASTLGVKRSKTASQLFTGGPVELFGIIAIVTFIISLTNGLESPLFFFLYFVLFLLAFLCESVTVWIFLVTILLYFLPQAFQNPNTNNMIKLGSLLLISPIAYFIGHEFETRQLLTKRVQTKTDEIIQEAQILKEDGKQGSPEQSEAIDEIIEEATSLKSDVED